jgi:ADP-ribose pyrophosphatase YjhB (NUDIX family)
VTGIVIREDGRVLAIQRNDNGRWAPPGGVLELDESPAEGVAREILEETGVKVRAENTERMTATNGVTGRPRRPRRRPRRSR